MYCLLTLSLSTGSLNSHNFPCTRITRWTLIEACFFWRRGLRGRGLHLEAKEEVGNGKKSLIGHPRGFKMRGLLIRCSPGRLLTILGSFSTSQYKLVTQTATVPHRCFQRHTMHYQTEERGHPNCPEYRIYFSK